MSPTTHLGDKSTTSVYGNVEPAFDLCELAHAAGATYVARGTSWGYQQLASVIAGGIAHKGFAMVEAMAICPVYYGRFNLTPDPAEFLRSQKEHAVPVDKFERGRDAQPRPLPGRAAAPPRARGVRHRARAPQGARRGRPTMAEQAGAVAGAARRRAARVEIRCSGSGGQGILLAAAIIAEAAAALGRHVVQTQSYGPEARGGASKAEVIVSGEPIDYPEVRQPGREPRALAGRLRQVRRRHAARRSARLRLRAGRGRPGRPDPGALRPAVHPGGLGRARQEGRHQHRRRRRAGAHQRGAAAGRRARRGPEPRAGALQGAQRAGLRSRTASGRRGRRDAGHLSRDADRRRLACAWTCSNTRERSSSPPSACRCCRRSWRPRRPRRGARPNSSARTSASRRRPRPAAAARRAASASAAAPPRWRPRPRTSWP